MPEIINKFKEKISNLNKCFATFYNNNLVFSWFISGASITIICGSIHFLFHDHQGQDFESAAKVWEITSYILTLFYTYWFWILSDEKKRGKDIRNNRLKDGGASSATWKIAMSVFLILVLTTYHISSLLQIHLNTDNNFLALITPYLKQYAGAINIFILCSIYYFFCKIGDTVVDNIDTDHSVLKKENKQIKLEIENGLKHIDKPIMIVFLVLTVFALFICYLDIYHEMEIFFSGAIAFELILSSVSWANTDTA